MTTSTVPQQSGTTKLNNRKKSRRTPHNFPWLLLAVSLLLFGSSCGRRPAPLPPGDSGAGPPPPAPPVVVPGVLLPELQVSVEPPVINPGESALLQWEARHADRVLINHNIGVLETSGRIRFFPDETTSYEVTAEGPGGRVMEVATIEVRVAPDADIGQEDLPALPRRDLFDRFVKPVFFEYDSAELSAEAEVTLAGNSLWLQRPENRGLRFLIEGHCDERGTDEYNLALGDRRAQAVRSYLVRGGVEASRITTVSYGEERPFDLRPEEEGWAMNRRAHFVLLQEDAGKQR